MTLLQRSVAGGVMIVVLMLFRRLTLNKLPKWSTVLLGDLTMLRLLVPLSIPSVWSVYTFLQRNTAITRTVPVRVVNAMPVEQIPVKEVTSITTGPIPSRGVVAAPSTFSDEQVLFFLWLAGVILLGTAFLIAYVRSYRRFALSLPTRDENILRWKNAHVLRRPYQIRISQEISSPLTYGIVCPVILLPKQLNLSASDALDDILTHEWTHIRRWDSLRKMSLALTLTIHWFNPLVWLFYWQMNQDVELACDEAVLADIQGDHRKRYALTLLTMEEKQLGVMPLYNGFSKSGIEERVRAIMKNKKPTFILSVIAILLVACVTVCFATSGAKHRQEPAPDESIQAFEQEISETIYDFLTAVYTTDYQGRFTALQELRDNPDATPIDDSAMEKAMTEYMSAFQDITTPECLEKMITNRIPYKYDGIHSEENPWTVNGISTAGSLETGVYDFSVSILPEREPITGQVTIDLETGLVANFWEGSISTVFGTKQVAAKIREKKETAIRNFLIALYTTNHGGRYTALKEFLSGSHHASTRNNVAKEIYLEEFQEMAFPAVLDKLWKEQIPNRYDERNDAYPWTVSGIALSGNEGSSEYEFSVVVRNDESFFVDEITGQIILDQQTNLISAFTEGAISAEFAQEDYVNLMPQNLMPQMESVDEILISVSNPNHISVCRQEDDLQESSFGCAFQLDEKHPHFRVAAWVPYGQEHDIRAVITDEKNQVIYEEVFSDEMSFRTKQGERSYPPGVYRLSLQSVDTSAPLNASVKVEINRAVIEEQDDRALATNEETTQIN